MIGSIHLCFYDDTWNFWEFERDFQTPLNEFLDIAFSLARDYCCERVPYVCVCVKSGSIKRCVGRYWYTEKGVVVDEKIL